jgi:hypothetical protein
MTRWSSRQVDPQPLRPGPPYNTPRDSNGHSRRAPERPGCRHLSAIGGAKWVPGNVSRCSVGRKAPVRRVADPFGTQRSRVRCGRWRRWFSRFCDPRELWSAATSSSTPSQWGRAAEPHPPGRHWVPPGRAARLPERDLRPHRARLQVTAARATRPFSYWSRARSSVRWSGSRRRPAVDARSEYPATRAQSPSSLGWWTSPSLASRQLNLG